MAEHISVSELTADHYSSVSAWLSNPEINKWLYAEWRDRQVTENLLAVVLMNPKNMIWLVAVNSRPFGIVGLADINPVDSNAMIWSARGDDEYLRSWIAENRRKLATPIQIAMLEGTRHVIRYAFEELKLRSINASIMAPNVTSHRLVQHLGFSKAGVMRKAFHLDGRFVDRFVYDILPEDLI